MTSNWRIELEQENQCKHKATLRVKKNTTKETRVREDLKMGVSFDTSSALKTMDLAKP